MKIIETPEAMRLWSQERRCAGETIGLVPTMGALHTGHESLMKQAVKFDDVAVVSIFVNPAQFAPHEDYDQYPRTFEQDVDTAESLGLHAVYAPKASSMYPPGYATYVEVERLQDGLCGISRPHFFRGVATVVTKLFNAVLPHRAYFGQKDTQQCAIIKRMARDLDFGIEVVAMPIVREADGLAMSSRNAYLSPEERKRSLCLHKSLFEARGMLENGERDAERIVATMRETMRDVEVDYVSVVSADDLSPLKRVEGPVVVATAAKVGSTRLIDNVSFDAD